MNTDQILYGILSGDEAVAALVGTRIRPHSAAFGEVLPLVTYVSDGELAGQPVNGRGRRTLTYTLDCYGVDQPAARAVADAVEAAFDSGEGWRRYTGEDWHATCFLGPVQDVPDDPDSGSDRPIPCIRVTVRVSIGRR
jgi:Protein of unknown function (DUF3168)